MQNEEIKRQIKDVIDGLRPDLRSVIILFYYDQMSMAEVAETMGISESIVKTKLFSARKRIKAKLRALGMNGDTTVHMTLVPLPALLALVADELDTSTAVVASPFGKAAVTATAGAAVFAAAVSMVFFTNANKGDVRVDSGTDSAESTVSIYTEEQSSANSLGDSLLTSSLSISSMAQNNILSDSQNGAVNTDTSTQSNYDSYVDTPNNNFTPNTPDTSSDNTTSSSSASSSSKADSSSSSDDDDFPKLFDYIELDDGTIKLVDFTGNWADGDIDTPSVVVIPEEYKGKKITVIGSRFMSSQDCSDGVKEVVIPDSVTTIERGAFLSGGGGETLEKIYIGKNVEKIEAGAFTMNEDVKGCKTKMTIDSDNKWYTIYDDGLYTKDLTEVFWYPPQTE